MQRMALPHGPAKHVTWQLLHSHGPGEAYVLGASEHLLWRAAGRALGGPGVLDKGLLHLFHSPYRARRSVNVKAIT